MHCLPHNGFGNCVFKSALLAAISYAVIPELLLTLSSVQLPVAERVTVSVQGFSGCAPSGGCQWRPMASTIPINFLFVLFLYADGYGFLWSCWRGSCNGRRLLAFLLFRFNIRGYIFFGGTFFWPARCKLRFRKKLIKRFNGFEVRAGFAGTGFVEPPRCSRCAPTRGERVSKISSESPCHALRVPA